MNAPLEWAPLSPGEQMGGVPGLGVSVKRADGEPLLFKTPAGITVDVGDLAAQAGWTKQVVEVIAEGVDSPLARKCTRLQTDGTKRTFGPPAGAVRRLVIRLLDLDPRTSIKGSIDVGITSEGQSSSVTASIDLTPKPPRITTFRARPSIAVIGQPLVFDIECERVSSWTLSDRTGRPLDSRSSVDQRSTARAQAPQPPHKIQKSGEYPFHLAVKGDGGTQSADVAVKVHENEGWSTAPRWWDGQVASLCVSQGGDTLYALVRSGGAASVWWTADGFGRWEELAVAPVGMVDTAPVTCFRLGGRLKLVFAGGSKVDSTRPFDGVWMLDAATKEWVRFDGCWPSRAGHACVAVADPSGVEMLWVVGGMDIAGNALSDIQVSADGKTWERKATPEWAARSMFGSTVKGSEIWVGGGFQPPDGAAFNDVWILDTRSLTARPLAAPGGGPIGVAAASWDLVALGLATLDGTVYLAGVERQIHDAGPTDYRTIFGALHSDRGGLVVPQRLGLRPAWAETHEEFRLETVAFNGCIWVFSQRSVGEQRVESSGLHYWIPPAAGSMF